MAKVTRIKAQKNKKRINVYLDGKYAFPLDVDNLFKSGLKVGQSLSEKEVEDLVFKNESQKTLDKSVRFLSYRPRSEKEIRDYLKKKKVLPKLVIWVMKKLKGQRLLDDQAFAEWWVEQRSSFRPRGARALRVELRQKGIDQEMIEETVSRLVKELPLARKVAQKKMRVYRRLEGREFREKMAAFLGRRGFSWETIKKVLAEMVEKR